MMTSIGITAQGLSEEEMRTILNTYDIDSKVFCNAQAKANWDVQTDVGNTEKERKQVSSHNRLSIIICFLII